MQSILQILKVNDARSGTKEGRDWKMQDAECVILKETGEADQVGVLMIPKDLMGVVQPGIYMGSFALRANTRKGGDRKIEAVLTSLLPYALKGTGAAGGAK